MNTFDELQPNLDLNHVKKSRYDGVESAGQGVAIVMSPRGFGN